MHYALGRDYRTGIPTSKNCTNESNNHGKDIKIQTKACTSVLGVTMSSWTTSNPLYNGNVKGKHADILSLFPFSTVAFKGRRPKRDEVYIVLTVHKMGVAT